ncbi:MAG TPA: hypothetical protein VFV65_02085 [Gemmatimonadales bacterium]|nr:hypothetical protein [Gemmatimonadales bacterium]
MVFVPAHRPAPPASPRAQDLGRRLQAEIATFEAQYPGTSRKDILAAAALAVGEESATVPPRRRVAAVAGSILAALGVAAGMTIPLAENGVLKSMPLWPIGALIFAFGIVAGMSIKRSRSR